MKLTEKELEIMNVLWRNGNPLTASEIIAASENRTWKEGSVYIIMKMLLKKGAVILAMHKPTVSNTARAYSPTLTCEEYIVANIACIQGETGVQVDIPALVNHLKKIVK